MQSIKDYVNNLYNLDIEKDTRKRQYVDARTFYYKLCRDLTKCNLSTIGESVGRDHSVVIHGWKGRKLTKRILFLFRI
mgnify:CR=1 FL=1